MGFRNTAGAKKHQAMALTASANLVAFHCCRVDGFQDSLYTHSNSQLILPQVRHLSTVDFIFGNSTVVLQNCNILPRVPMQG